MIHQTTLQLLIAATRWRSSRDALNKTINAHFAGRDQQAQRAFLSRVYIASKCETANSPAANLVMKSVAKQVDNSFRAFAAWVRENSVAEEETKAKQESLVSNSWDAMLEWRKPAINVPRAVVTDTKSPELSAEVYKGSWK